MADALRAALRALDQHEQSGDAKRSKFFAAVAAQLTRARWSALSGAEQAALTTRVRTALDQFDESPRCADAAMQAVARLFDKSRVGLDDGDKNEEEVRRLAERAVGVVGSKRYLSESSVAALVDLCGADAPGVCEALVRRTLACTQPFTMQRLLEALVRVLSATGDKHGGIDSLMRFEAHLGPLVDALLAWRIFRGSFCELVDAALLSLGPLWAAQRARTLPVADQLVSRLLNELSAALVACNKRNNGPLVRVADSRFCAHAAAWLVLVRSLGAAAYVAASSVGAHAPLRFVSLCLGVARHLPTFVGDVLRGVAQHGLVPFLSPPLVVQVCAAAAAAVHSDHRHINAGDEPLAGHARHSVVAWLAALDAMISHHGASLAMFDELDVSAFIELRLSTSRDVIKGLLRLQAIFFGAPSTGAAAVRALARDVRLAHTLARTPLSSEPVPPARRADVRSGHYLYCATRADARRLLTFALLALGQVPASLLHVEKLPAAVPLDDAEVAENAADIEADRQYVEQQLQPVAAVPDDDQEAGGDDEPVDDLFVPKFYGDDDDDSSDDDGKPAAPVPLAVQRSFLLRPLEAPRADAPAFTPLSMRVAAAAPAVAERSAVECRQEVSMTLRGVLAQLQTRMHPLHDVVASSSAEVSVGVARLAEHLLSLCVGAAALDGRLTVHATAQCTAQLVAAQLRAADVRIRDYALRWLERVLGDARLRAALLESGERAALLLDSLLDCSLGHVPDMRLRAASLSRVVVLADSLTRDAAVRAAHCAALCMADNDAAVRGAFAELLALLAPVLVGAERDATADQRTARAAMWRRLLMTTTDTCSEASNEQLAAVFAPLAGLPANVVRPLAIDWQRVLTRCGTHGAVLRLLANIQEATALVDEGSNVQQEFVDAPGADELDGAAAAEPPQSRAAPPPPSPAKRADGVAAAPAPVAASSVASKAALAQFGAGTSVVSARDVAMARVAGGPSARPQDWLPMADALTCDDSLARFGAISAVARIAVAARLHTPFGDAQQTLVGLERAIRAVVPLLCGYAEQSAAAWPFAKADTAALAPLVGNEAFLARARDGADAALAVTLLELCEAIEKHIHHSAFGAVTVSLAPPSAADAFFAANIKTCTDWFSRVRPQLLALSLAVGAYDEAARHGEQRISDLRAQVGGSSVHDVAARLARADANVVSRYSQQLGAALLQTASAFAERGEPDAIDGFVVSSQQLVGACQQLSLTLALPVDELLALQAEASGATERAVVLYRELLARAHPPAAAWRPFCSDRLQLCLLQLGDWNALAGLRASAAGAELDALIRDDFVRAMVAYGDGDSRAARDLLATAPLDVVASVDGSQQPMLTRSDALRRRWASERLVLHALLLEPSARAAPLKLAGALLQPSLRALRDVSQPAMALHAIALCDDAASSGGVWRLAASARRGAAPSLQSGCAWFSASRSDALVLAMCDAARTAGNLQLADRLLRRQFGAAELAVGETAVAAARVLHASGRRGDAVEMLCSMLGKASDNGALVADCRLQLGEWLRRERHVPDSAVVAALERAAAAPSAHWSVALTAGIDRDAHPGVVEAAAGRQFLLATEAAPTLARAWSVYADWNYRVGHRLVDQLRAVEWRGELLEDEGERVAELVVRALEAAPAASADALRSAVVAAVRTCVLEFDADVVRSHDADVRQALVAAGVTDASVLDGVCALNRGVRARYLSHYASATTAYFRFLQLGGGRVSGSEVTASLRLLRLLVKHSGDLEPLLRDGLRATPAAAWRDVIPQLCARLRSLGGSEGAESREVELTRELLCTALCRVADDLPHTVLFAALVGAKAERGGGGGALSFGRVRQQLAERNARLVREAETLMHEFERITVLPGECWTTTLQRIQGTGEAKLSAARAECDRLARTDATPQLAARRAHDAILAPVAALIDAAVDERLAAARQSVAGDGDGAVVQPTPADVRCERAFVPMLRELSAKLLAPTDDVLADESAAWQPLRDALRQAARLSRPGVFELGDVSPTLAVMRQLAVAMPGVEHVGSGGGVAGGPITIESFGASIEMLASKTRPKKLHAVGSNGRAFVYLLKGREDLRLDERVMQFLRCVNQLLGDGATTVRARHYAVIPLGPRAGLIQWIDGLVPLYSLYKAWQRRQSAEQASARPADVFYGKVLPRLRAHNMDSTTPRADWPLSVLRDVYDELRRATPNSLLARELWCSSPSPSAWLQARATYANSCAVMSVAGWVLGLGDRHLDNILVDFRSGEMLHIDYNVCFERGLRLRIPERVPFRMTQNMECALGPSGVNGQFRRTCERVMTALCANRELLLTLLEAFIYDPLAEWTGEADAADREHLRQEMRLAIGIALERAAELGALISRDNDDATLTAVAGELRATLLPCVDAAAVRAQHAPVLQRAAARRAELQTAAAQLAAAEAEESARVAETAARLAKLQQQLADEQRQAAAFLHECTHVAASNDATFELVRSAVLAPSLASLSSAVTLLNEEPSPLRDAARLLEGPPAPGLAKREQADRELLRSCADVDQQMTAVLRDAAPVMSSAIAAVSAMGDALRRVPASEARALASARAVALLQPCVEPSDDDEALKRARQAADKQARVQVARGERDLWRQSVRRERGAQELFERLQAQCASAQASVNVVDDAQAELGRATQRLADARAAMSTAQAARPMPLLGATFAPLLARASDALRHAMAGDEAASASVEQFAAREGTWRDAIRNGRLLAALLEQLVLDAGAQDDAVGAAFAAASGETVATMLETTVRQLNGVVHLIDRLDTARAQFAATLLPRLLATALPGSVAESSVEGAALRQQLATAQQICADLRELEARRQTQPDLALDVAYANKRFEVDTLLAYGSSGGGGGGAQATLWTELCALFTPASEAFSLLNADADVAERMRHEASVSAVAAMVDACARAALVPPPAAAATATAAAMPRILGASDLQQSVAAQAWFELSVGAPRKPPTPSPLDALLKWQDEFVRVLLAPAATRALERCARWLATLCAGVDANAVLSARSDEPLARVLQRALHAGGAVDVPALTTSLTDMMRMTASDAAPLLLYRALTQRALEAQCALTARAAVTFAVAWRADGAARLCRQLDDGAARGSKKAAPSASEFEHEHESLRQRDQLRGMLLDAVQQLGDPTRVVSMAARLQAASGLHTRVVRAAALCSATETTLRARLEARMPASLALFDARTERRRARLARLTEAHVELVAVVNVLMRIERQAPFVAEGGEPASATANYAALMTHVAQLAARLHDKWTAAHEARRAWAAAQDARTAAQARAAAASAELADAEAAVARCQPLVASSGDVLRRHAAALAALEQQLASLHERAVLIERDAVPPLAAVFGVARRLARRQFGPLQSALSAVLDRIKASAGAALRVRAAVAACRVAPDAAAPPDAAAVAADIELVARLFGSSLRAELDVALGAARTVQSSDALVGAAHVDDADDVDDAPLVAQQQAQPQRNVRAVAIVRRIKQKLEAREQVAGIIEQATNAENLAQMFEGWLAWC